MSIEAKVNLIFRAYPQEAEALRNRDSRAAGFCEGVRDAIKYLLVLKREGKDEADEQFPSLQVHDDQ